MRTAFYIIVSAGLALIAINAQAIVNLDSSSQQILLFFIDNNYVRAVEREELADTLQNSTREKQITLLAKLLL